jgi:predicted GIY-YIG superfamily endonuclease
MITKDKNLTFNLEGNQIECESKVYLLGVTIDFELNFNEHISNICKMASLLRVCFHLVYREPFN